eukprot:1156446-Pelagomonas_calceolata.AAC.6
MPDEGSTGRPGGGGTAGMASVALEAVWRAGEPPTLWLAARAEKCEAGRAASLGTQAGREIGRWWAAAQCDVAGAWGVSS